MTITRSNTRRSLSDIRSDLERLLWDLRRSAIGPFAEAVVLEKRRQAVTCASCAATIAIAIEVEASAEFLRGQIRGVEIAMETMEPAEEGVDDSAA